MQVWVACICANILLLSTDRTASRLRYSSAGDYWCPRALRHYGLPFGGGVGAVSSCVTIGPFPPFRYLIAEPFVSAVLISSSERCESFQKRVSASLYF